MAKIEFIDKSNKMKCWSCNNKGYKKCACDNGKICVGFSLTERPIYEQCYTCQGTGKLKCKTCNGTGIFIEKNYILVYTNNKGEKMGFMVEGIK